MCRLGSLGSSISADLPFSVIVQAKESTWSISKRMQGSRSRFTTNAPGPCLEHSLDFFLESRQVREGPIHRGEPNVGHVIELPQLFHDQAAQRLVINLRAFSASELSFYLIDQL